MAGMIITQNGISQTSGTVGADARERAARAAAAQRSGAPIQSSVLANALRREPQSPDFDAAAYVAGMNPASLNELILYGPNLPGASDRLAAIQAAKARLQTLNPTQVPTGNGMSQDGVQQGVTPMPDYDPGVAQGTNNTPVPDTVVDYGAGSPNDLSGPRPPDVLPGNIPIDNGMAPDGGQNFPTPPPTQGGGSGDDPFTPPMGNVTADWGPNSDFYNNQFNQLLGQSNAFQDAQRTASAQRADAQANPTAAPAGADWSWLEGGLPEVETGGPPTSWELANGITEGMTNRDVLNQLSGQLDPLTVDFYQMNWGDGQPGADQSWWTQKSGPTDFLSAYAGETNDYAMQSQRDLANTLFRGNTNPAVPAGYAAPRPGMQPGGYQEGGAAFVYDPVSGGYTSTGVTASPGVRGGGAGNYSTGGRPL